MKEKIALVLFVKNEAHDLIGWLAWHLTSGFDTLVIFEDSSSDQTTEIIDTAAKFYDVRRYPVPESLHFQHRQQAAYLQARDMLCDEFDWVGFIDADEYVYLPQHADAHDYFAEFPATVGAVALNWKCYGSGWHVLKPGSNVPEQFESHSTPEFFENNTVKSFVRISEMKPVYQDPHRFDVEGDIVGPTGHSIEWHETERHRIATVPDWSKGAILHYAVRSAEHYIEKVKRRSDIRNNVDIGFFTWLNKNDIHAPLPAEKLRRMNKVIARIQNEMCQSRLLSFLSTKSPYLPKTEASTYKPYFLQSHFQTILVSDPQDGVVCHVERAEMENGSALPLILFVSDNKKDPAFLVLPKATFLPIGLFGESQVGSCLAFHTNWLEDGKLCIQSAVRKRYLTCIPEDNGSFGKTVKVNADWAREWEQFTLIDLSDEVFAELDLGRWQEIVQGAKIFSFPELEESEIGFAADCFGAVLATLPEQDTNRFLYINDIISLPWIGGRSSISY